MHTPQRKDYTLVAIILLCVLGAVAAAYFVMQNRDKNVPKFSKEYEVVLSDYDGAEVRLSQFRYTRLIVFMWASWCPYCADELRNLQDIKRQLGNKIEVLAVNRAEPLVVARQFTDALGEQSNIRLLLDPEDALFHSMDGYAMPETVFVDVGGKVFFHQRGPMQKSDVLEKLKGILKLDDLL